jgi:hypothetical protein
MIELWGHEQSRISHIFILDERMAKEGSHHDGFQSLGEATAMSATGSVMDLVGLPIISEVDAKC